MGIKIGINGFGRIGRNVMRAALRDRELEFVAVNDLTDAATLAHLLKYDSIHGTLPAEVRAEDQAIIVDGTRIRVLSERDPAKLPWRDLGVNVVLECTGLFTTRDRAASHLAGGAKKVIISAPAKDVDLTICYGVNHDSYRARGPSRHLQRFLHDQLSRPTCEGPARELRHRPRPDDHGSRLHERPTDPGPAP